MSSFSRERFSHFLTFSLYIYIYLSIYLAICLSMYFYIYNNVSSDKGGMGKRY